PLTQSAYPSPLFPYTTLFRSRLAGFRASDLHDHHRHAAPGGVIGRLHQRTTVLEPLDVGDDHTDVGLVGEVRREVGELEIDLVADRKSTRLNSSHLGISYAVF